MLILTRKPGESVIVEESVRITVLEVRGSQVKLGIQAPQEVRVNREEVLERQRAESNLPPLDTLPGLAPPPRAPERRDSRPSGERASRERPTWEHASRDRSAAEREGAAQLPVTRRAAGRHAETADRPARADRRSPRPASFPRNQAAANRPRPPYPISPSAAGRRDPTQPMSVLGARPGERVVEPEPDTDGESVRRYRLPPGRHPFGRRLTAGRPIPAEEEDLTREEDLHRMDAPEASAADDAAEHGLAPDARSLDPQAPPARSRVKRSGGEAA